MHVVAWASMYGVSYFREDVVQNELELVSGRRYTCDQFKDTSSRGAYIVLQLI